MFMGKVELDNIVQLLKIRKKECVGIRRYIFSFLLLMFAMDLIALIQKTFTYATEVSWLTHQIYSSLGLILMMIACVIYTISYKEYNLRLQVFPQSNKSRFISYELFCYISFLKIQLLSLTLYFVQYGIGMILSLIKGNIKFAYQFSLQFIVAGFLVNLMYGFVAIAFVILIGVLDRKFKWIFRIVGIGSIIIGLAFQEYSLPLLGNVIHIITRESSIILFLIKIICLWIVLICIYHSINKHTKNFEAEKKLSNTKKMIAIAVTVALALLIIAFINYSSYSITDSISSANVTKVETSMEETIEQEDWQIPDGGIKSIIDISNILEGAEIKIVLSEEDKHKYNIVFREGITNSSNDKLIIVFDPSESIVDWTEMSLFTETKLEAKLKNNTLYLDVTSDENVKVLFVTPYSFMWQFDYFIGKQIFKEHPGSMGGSGSHAIMIYRR